MKNVSVLLFVVEMVTLTAARLRENIAYKKESKQSSTYMHFTALEAKYANDGLLDQVIEGSAVCAHTLVNKPNYWWAVDLGGSHEIGSVTIYNRKDSGERMNEFSVFVFNPVEATSFSADPDVLCYFHKGQCPDILNLKCNRKIKGRYLQIYKDHRTIRGGDALVLCEVLVFESSNSTRNQFCREERRRPFKQISTHTTTAKTVCAALCNQKENCIGFQSRPGGTCDLYQTSMTVDTPDSAATYYEKC